MERPTIVDALRSLITQEHGWDFLEDKILWRETNTGDPPTRTEIDTELKRLQDEYDSLSWKRSRQESYPQLQECIHALLDGGDTLTNLQAKRAEVKSKFPKG